MQILFQISMKRKDSAQFYLIRLTTLLYMYYIIKYEMLLFIARKVLNSEFSLIKTLTIEKKLFYKHFFLLLRIGKKKYIEQRVALRF